MRILILFSLLILLTSCATTNYYDHTIDSWRGSKSQSLIASWGQPNQIIRSANGEQALIYTTQPRGIGYNQYQNVTYAVGRGRALAVQVPSNQPQANLVGCTTVFTINNQGIVTGTRFFGGDCVGKAKKSS